MINKVINKTELIVTPSLLQLTLNDLERMGVPTLRFTAQYLADHGYTGPDGRYFVDNREVRVIENYS